MRRGYWKNGGRETFCVHPCSLASFRLSFSPSRPSPSFSLQCHPFLPHISHQCPLWSNRASHLKFCGWHLGRVLRSCCILESVVLSTGKAKGKHGSGVELWTCRQSKDRYFGQGKTVPPVTCRFKHPIDPWANTSPLLSALSSVEPCRCVYIYIWFWQICGDTY